MEQNISENKFLIIDGNSIMNRAFYGIKLLTTKDGMYTNAIYGFLNILFMIQEKINPEYLAVTFDLSAPTFRHKMYAEYKATRHKMPDELRMQIPVIKDVLKAMNIQILELEGYEADDILGTVAKFNDLNSNENGKMHTYILTGDRDSFQLISDNTTIIMPSNKPGKTEYTYYNKEALYEKYGVTPSQVIDVKALMGDTADNIPGVPGIGEKTAYPLIIKNNTLEQLYDNIDNLGLTPKMHEKLTTNKEMATLSKKLATINTDVPITLSYEDFLVKEPNKAELIKLFTRLEFKKLIDKYDAEGSVDIATNEYEKNIQTQVKSTNFIDLSKNMELLDNVNTSSNISFVYFTDKEPSFKMRLNELNGIFAYVLDNQTNVYYIKDTSDGFRNVLKTVLTSKACKITYAMKSSLKPFLEGGGLSENVTQFEDIMIQYYLLNAIDTNYSLKAIIYNTIDLVMSEDTFKSEVVQTSLFELVEAPSINKEIEKYIATTVYSIQKIHKILSDQIEEKGLNEVYRNIELPLIPVLADMEKNGMYVHREKLKEFGESLRLRIDEIRAKVIQIAGQEFNLNSTQQLAHILFEVLNIPYPKKGTNYSTDKETLESIDGEYEIIDLMLEYRALNKLMSTYVDGLSEVIGEDNRIHTTFMQAVTATGRLSSIEPNLQNIPVRTELGGKIRECFVAEKDNILIDADYSQIELRVLAHMANDTNMLNAFKSGLDVHSITASQVFGVPVKEVTHELRSRAKAVNFGIVYGISEFGLAKNIKSSRQDAKKYIANYLNHYKGIDNFMKNSIENGKAQGYVKTLFGRQRSVPELKSANYMTRQFGERIAMNMPVQGTSADIMKIAMINTYNELKSQKLNAKLIMQVHDELIIECSESELEKVKQILKKCMENAYSLNVPLQVDVNCGKNWLEAK